MSARLIHFIERLQVSAHGSSSFIVPFPNNAVAGELQDQNLESCLFLNDPVVTVPELSEA